MPTDLERLRVAVDSQATATLSRTDLDKRKTTIHQRIVSILERQQGEIDYLREEIGRERVERQEKIDNLDSAVTSLGQFGRDLEGRIIDQERRD